MKKIRNWFIGDYIEKTDDVFEKARIELTFSYSIIFFTLGLFFYANLIVNSLWYHVYSISFGIISLATIPFVLKYRQNLRLAASLYLIQQFVVSFTETLLQEGKLDIQLGLFTMTIILFAFFIFNTKTGFLISLLFITPLLISVLNTAFQGKLIQFDIPPDQKMPQEPIFVLMPLALNLYVIWKFMQTRNLAEKQIKQQKKEIEQKNKDIIDSIHYAKRIQTSLLPTDKYINRIINRVKKD